MSILFLAVLAVVAVVLSAGVYRVSRHAQSAAALAAAAQKRAWRGEQIAIAAHVRADARLIAEGVALETNPPDRPRARHLHAVPTGGAR